MSLPRDSQDEVSSSEASAGSRRGGFTRRAVALAVVLLLLIMSYGASLRVWVETEQANAANRESMERSQERIDVLNAELARWDDPDYVRAQARERLGWVMPGDTGYRVVGQDGEPIGQQLDRPGYDPGAPVETVWWQRLWGSIQAADEQDAVPGSPDVTEAPKPPLTDGTRTPTPSATPTPRKSATPTPGKSATPTPRKTPTPTSSVTARRSATPTATASR